MLRQRLIKLFLFGILVAALYAAGYFYLQAQALKQNTPVVVQDESDDLVEKISKLVVLPVNEIPTIATVSDIELLKNQPFFASAKAGDKVLIYTQAKKAILYDVTLNKIIDIAPLNIGIENTPILESEE